MWHVHKRSHRRLPLSSTRNLHVRTTHLLQRGGQREGKRPAQARRRGGRATPGPPAPSSPVYVPRPRGGSLGLGRPLRAARRRDAAACTSGEGGVRAGRSERGAERERGGEREGGGGYARRRGVRGSVLWRRRWGRSRLPSSAMTRRRRSALSSSICCSLREERGAHTLGVRMHQAYA